MLILSKTQIFNDDCLNLIKQLPNNSIDVCLTDPPYGIDFQSNARKNKLKKILNDEEPFTDWIKPLYSKLKEGGRLICFYRWDVQDAFLNEIRDSGFIIKSQLVWNKNQPGMGDLEGEFAPSHELMIYATKGRYTFKNKRPKTVFNCSRVSNNQIHPNEKPLKLIVDLLQSISEPNEIVLEPFVGSGVTVEACIKTNRICVGTELDEDYFKLAKRRVDKLLNISNNDFF